MESKGRAADVVALGLPEFRLLEAAEVEGELELTVETATVGWCRVCRVRARSKGRYETLVGDVSAFGRRVRLRWRKRRWRCPEPGCSARTWTEQSEAIRQRAVLTERARQVACRRVGEGGEAVAAVARDLGTGWRTVMSAVADHGEALVEDPARLFGVTALGMDETAWLRANRHHHTLYVSGLVDTATGRLLDVVPDRTARAVADWLARRDPEWLTRIGVVALDPHRGYANAVGVHLGHATLVVDHFHIIKVRHEAPCSREGCKDPPVVCRSRPLKLGAA